MIFKSKKAFEDAVEERLFEIQFKTRTDEDLMRLRDQVRDLDFRVRCIEDRGRECKCQTGAAE